MDWSKTKTIFIFVFLILDLFLLYQFYTKLTSSEMDYLIESSFDLKLKENEITYSTLPNQTGEVQTLTAKSLDFSKEDDVKKLKNQTIKSDTGNMLTATFTKPFMLGDDVESESLDAFVKENILYGSEYRYWGESSYQNSIIYYQVVHDKMIYESSHSKIELFYNQKNEITRYEQTYLKDIEPFIEEDEKLLQAKQVLEVLYNNGYLPSKSEITSMELGYTNLDLLSTSHVLTPTWHVFLNNKDHLYVNAFKGEVIKVDESVDEPENGDDDGSYTEESDEDI